VTPEEFVAMLRHNAEWADLGGMNLRTFYENKPAILADIRVLMDNPKSRKRFRLLAVYARETGEPLAEVFSTNHGPVVVFRSGSRHHGAEGVEFVRQDRGSANLVVAPLDNDPDGQQFPLIASSGGQCTLLNRELRRLIADGLRDGTRRRAVSVAHNGA
jgi:hypothetical protein